MHRAVQKTGLSLSVWLAVATAGILLAMGPAAGQQSAVEDIFVVRDVRLDETAETAAAARARALATGQQVAFGRLLARLTRSIHRSRVGNVDTETLRFLVDTLQIDDEKTSDIRYLANLTVTFKPEAVRGLLRAAGVPYAEVRSRPSLVIPVLERGGQFVLWEDPNPWREAWRNHPPGTGLVPVIAPVGDLADFLELTAAQAVEGDRAVLQGITERYAAESALVAIATIDQPEPGTFRVNVTGSRIGSRESTPVIVSFRGQPGEALPAFLDRAVAAIIETLEDDWKITSAVAFGDIMQIRAAVPITSLQNWVETRARIEQVPAVNQVRVIALTANSAEIEIVYQGDLTRLARAFDRFDLALEETGLDANAPRAFPVTTDVVPLTHVVRLVGG